MRQFSLFWPWELPKQKYLLHSRDECDPGSTCSSPGQEWQSFTGSLFGSSQAWAQLPAFAVLSSTNPDWKGRTVISGNQPRPCSSCWASLTSLAFFLSLIKAGADLQLLSEWSTRQVLGFTSHVVLESTDLYLCNKQFWKHISAPTGHKMPHYL